MIKYIVFAFGCVAIYGIATGQDLNTLFSDAFEHALPVAKSAIQGVWTFLSELLKK